MDVFALTMRLREEGAGQVKAAVDKLRQSTAAAAKDANKYDNQLQSLKRTFASLVSIGAVAATVNKFATATAEAQAVQAQLAAALKSTNGVSGQTIESLNAHAAALQRITMFGDEATNSAQALLLTFTKIGGDVFPKATEAVLDMATRMNGDLKGAAIQVGKALNDPVAGVTALSRAGVSFSDDQQAMIKRLVETNQLAAAQAIVLKELKTEFGDSARAARNTLGGALAAIGNAFGDLFEMTDESGKQITGFLNIIANNIPKLQGLINGFVSGLLTALPRITGLVAGAAGSWLAYQTAIISVTAYQALATGGSVITGLLNLANAVKTIAKSSALLQLSVGGWAKALIAVGTLAAGYAAYNMVAGKLDEITAEIAEQIKKMGKEAAGAGKPTEDFADATGNLIEQLVELAGIAPISTRHLATLTAEEERLTRILADGNLPLAKQLELTKQLIAVREAAAGATVQLTRAQSAEMQRLMAGNLAAPEQLDLTGKKPKAFFQPELEAVQAKPIMTKPPVIIDFAAEARKIKERADKFLDPRSLNLRENYERLQEDLASGFGGALSDGIAAGFERMMQKGATIADGFKALTGTILQGLGTMLVQFGTKALIAAINISTLLKNMINPKVSIPAALAIIALGASLRGAGQRIFSSGGRDTGGAITAPSLGGGMGSPMSGVTGPQLLYGPTAAGGVAQIGGAAPVNVTIIGPNDPSAQRAMQELIQNANRRGNTFAV